MLDKDIVVDFKKETSEILLELEEIVEGLESVKKEFPAELLAAFAQRIDRIMGAAKTIGMSQPNHNGLQRIGAIAQLCKELGYRAAESNAQVIVPLFAAFWADTLEVIAELVNSLEDEQKSAELANSFSSVLEKRLTWLSEKLNELSKPGLVKTNLIESQKLILEKLKQLKNKP